MVGSFLRFLLCTWCERLLNERVSAKIARTRQPCSNHIIFLRMFKYDFLSGQKLYMTLMFIKLKALI